MKVIAGRPKHDPSLLQAALTGYQLRLAEIDAGIAALRRRLGSPVKVPGLLPSLAVPRKKRRMSAAARKRISAAQKKRWAVFHRKQGK